MSSNVIPYFFRFYHRKVSGIKVGLLSRNVHRMVITKYCKILKTTEGNDNTVLSWCHGFNYKCVQIFKELHLLYLYSTELLMVTMTLLVLAVSLSTRSLPHPSSDRCRRQSGGYWAASLWWTLVLACIPHDFVQVDAKLQSCHPPFVGKSKPTWLLKN